MITNGECGCFNPILLECLLDIQDRIKRKMKTGTPEDNPFKKREKKAELKEFENVKEDFMDVSKAKVGDKTLVDAFYPAVSAIAETEGSIEALLDAAAEAAKKALMQRQI